nr:hypothetical protein Iba_chr14cCG3470 [Ipomoea batatas]
METSLLRNSEAPVTPPVGLRAFVSSWTPGPLASALLDGRCSALRLLPRGSLQIGQKDISSETARSAHIVRPIKKEVRPKEKSVNHGRSLPYRPDE